MGVSSADPGALGRYASAGRGLNDSLHKQTQALIGQYQAYLAKPSDFRVDVSHALNDLARYIYQNRQNDHWVQIIADAFHNADTSKGTPTVSDDEITALLAANVVLAGLKKASAFLFGDLTSEDRGRADRRIRNDRLTRTPEGGRDGGSHFDSDWAGREILDRYLSGGGDWTINNDPRWNKYMMDNNRLADDLHGRVQNLALQLYDRHRETGQTSGMFNDTFHEEIENGESIVGYQYLHGTNKDVGDFSMRGDATISPTADGHEVRIKANYTWNDKIDPNPEYETDTWKSRIAEIATLGKADPYDIHITWPAETVVRLDRNGKVISVEGYPAR